MKLHFAVILVLLLWSARTEAREDWKSDSAIILLHRAACLAAPENTVPALEAAVRQGADGVEIDIRRTRDGVLILYHDDWVLRQRGPSGKIEEMTLAETQRLDVGERFGPKWRGLHPPLFEDALRFARANSLRLYLDIKTPGLYDDVLKITTDLGCLPLVVATGGQVPANSYRVNTPWIGIWNYDKGGEEDPEQMAGVVSRAPQGAYQVMAEDARELSRALGRHPERRPFVPFVSTLPQRLAALRKTPSPPPAKPTLEALQSADASVRRAACLGFAERPDRAALPRLLVLAAQDPNATVRQEACWALGSLRDDRAVPTLLEVAQMSYDPKTAARTNYEAVFIKIGAACALARLNSDPGRAALQRLLDSKAEFDRPAAAIALAAFGTNADVPTLTRLVEPKPENAGFVVSSVMGHVGRLGERAIPIFIAALPQDEVAKFAVFGLAHLGAKAKPALRKVIDDTTAPPVVRRRASLALYWMGAENRSQTPEANVTFKDRTAGLGLTLGTDAACWVDVDNDGWVDLCASGVVWKNNAGKGFTRFSETGAGVAADFDNDGFADLFSWSQLKLYRNDAGKGFVEFELPALPKCVSRGACWGDFNGDGFVDLYVGGYEDWDAGITYPSLLLINQSGRAFHLAWSDGTNRTRGVTACDFDRDGDLDVYVSNYRLQPNRLRLNDGSGRFQEVAAGYNAVATSPGFDGGHSIGAAWGDFDNDGNIDLFAGNFAHQDSRGDQPKSRFLRSLGPLGGYKFDDRGTCGVFYQESYATPAAGDYDNDGHLDLFFTTVYGVASFNRPNYPVLYHNEGGFVFTDVTAISHLAQQGPTYQAAWADFDHDGDLDLVTAGKLFVNEGNANRWLEVRLIGDGRAVNRSAIGAQVRIKLKESTLTRQVEAGTGEGNQNDLTLHFGLGDHKGSVDLEVFWPNGRVQAVRKVGPNHRVECRYELPR